jgi:hypothetical protein
MALKQVSALLQEQLLEICDMLDDETCNSSCDASKVVDAAKLIDRVVGAPPAITAVTVPIESGVSCALFVLREHSERLFLELDEEEFFCKASLY